MHILYFSPKPIYPTVDGGCFAMESFLKSLSARFENLHCFSLVTEKHPGQEVAFKQNFPQIPYTTFPIQTKVNPFKVLVDFIHTESYNIARFYDPTIHQSLKEYIDQHQIKVLVIESIFLGYYLKNLPKELKIIVRTHNVEHQLWQNYALFESNFFKKLIYHNIYRKIKKEEISILQKADQILSLSLEDAVEFEKFNIAKDKINYIPIGIKVNKRIREIDLTKICHLGSMNWKPNIQSVAVLTNEILPKLLIKHPSITLHLAGFKMKKQSNPSAKNIVFHGFVEDPIQFYLNNGILVTPIKIASGVRVKILEALANGIPVITSVEGAKGIPNKGQLLVCQNPSAMIEAIDQCINDTNFVKDHIEKGYLYIQNEHDPEQISLKLKSIIGV